MAIAIAIPIPMATAIPIPIAIGQLGRARAFDEDVDSVMPSTLRPDSAELHLADVRFR